MSPAGLAQGEVLWTPPADVAERTELGSYLAWLRRERGLDFPGYDELWQWSVTDLEGFWSSLWDYFGIRASVPYERVLGSRAMPGAEWFPGARLNYAEHMLGRDDDAGEVAVVAHSQTRDPVELTFGELRAQVARARAGLERLGVGPGDRVVAYLPNIPETLVAFLATASLGAVWATCPPEFGVRSVVSRLGQLEPAVLLAVAGYGWGDRRVDRREPIAAIRAQLPTLRAVVHVPYVGGEDDVLPDATLVGRPARGGRAARVRAGAVRASALRPLLVRDDRTAEGDRPRARRHPARAPEEPRPQLGSAAGRPPPVVHDDRVDDVERARLDAARPRVDRDGGREPVLSGPRAAMAARRDDPPDDAGPRPGVRDGLPQGGGGARSALRPLVAPLDRRRGVAADPRGLRVALRPGRPGRPPEHRKRRHRHLHGDRAGEPAAAGLRGRDVGTLPRGRGPGLRAGRAARRRRAGRAGDHRADAVDAGRPLERPRRLPPARRLLRRLPRPLAARRLDPLHRAWELGDHGPLGRDAEPRRRPPRDERVLRRRGGGRRGARQPRRPSRRRGRAAPLRRAPRGRRARRRPARADRVGAARLALPAPRPRRDRRRPLDPAHADGQEARAPVKRILSGTDAGEVVSTDALVDPGAVDAFVAYARTRAHPTGKNVVG